VRPPGFEPGSSARKAQFGEYGPVLSWRATKNGFKEYVQYKKYNPLTAKSLISYLDKYVTEVGSPIDVMRLFKDLTVGQAHHLNRALRAWFNYLEITRQASKEYLDVLRKAIPKDGVGVDIKVPSEKEIVENLRKLVKAPLKYKALWNLLLDSGIRLVEAVKVIDDFAVERLERLNGFYRYRIGEFRGSKQAYYAYFTPETLQLIREARERGEKIGDRRAASHYFSKYGFTSPKYLRKFVNDVMTSEQLNIPESVSDFIEGRVARSIGARHYMQLRRKADGFYPRYAEYVKKLRGKAGII